MSQRVLRLVLRLADAPSSAALAYDDVMRWSEAERAALLDGWLRDAGHQRQYTCTECGEECTEEVQFRGGEDGAPLQAFIVCPGAHGRILIPLEQLRHWVVSPGHIAASLSTMIGAGGEPKEIIGHRLWWLGRRQIRGQQVTVFFARGTAWRDAGTVYASAGELRSGEMQVVLVPGRVPAPGVLGAGTKTVPLQQVLELGADGLRVDLAAVEQVVPRSRARVVRHLIPFRTAPGTTWEQVMIEFLDGDTVRVSVLGQGPQERSFVEMGFQDRRQTGEECDKLWQFLRLLAKEDGRLSSEDSGRTIPAASFGKVKKWVADIRSRLRALFPDIDGDPFMPYRRLEATGNQRKPYEETRTYETRFTLRWEGASRRG